MLRILGVIFLGLILLISGVLTYSFFAGSKLKKESKVFVDSAIPFLVKEWDPKELKSRASKDLLALIKEPDLTNMYAVYKRLGKMTHYNSSKGNAMPMINGPDGIQATAQYIATAKFENGDAIFRIALYKRNGNWEISSLYIESPLFLKK